MEPRDDNNLRDSEFTVEDDLEGLFDIIDIINRNFVAEVEDAMARSKKMPPQLAALH